MTDIIKNNYDSEAGITKKIKVYPLHVGDTKIPVGQFYYKGLKGVNANKEWLRFFTTGKVQNIIAPIHSYLIEHPKEGLILVDTGINRFQANEHKEYYKQSRALSFVLGEDEYILSQEQELPAQIERLGYQCEDVKTIIMTHLHEDHVGGLRYFPNARVIVAQKEYDLVKNHVKLFLVVPLIYEPSVDMVRNWDPINYTSGPFHNFSKSQDVFGDGSIIMLPTPGHDPGHSCVLVQMDGYELLILGDIIYTFRHLDVDNIRQVIYGGKEVVEQQVNSIRSIRQLKKEMPNLVIVTLHDNTDYQFKYLDTFLSNGTLSPEELEKIKTYEKSIFDSELHLRPDAFPKFIPPEKGEDLGKII
ncbi:MAG TPA: N-acyl homoserine lactonase family protein [Methanobacteriaceae archaeon]|nr:N-acyl homoserine lactonase family protein [Methanobacteriaceae archaeon]